MTATLTRAIERLGIMRENLTALQGMAADLEDAEFSQLIRGLMHSNTAAMERLTDLRKEDDEGARHDFAGQSADTLRGG